MLDQDSPRWGERARRRRQNEEESDSLWPTDLLSEAAAPAASESHRKRNRERREFRVP